MLATLFTSAFLLLSTPVVGHVLPRRATTMTLAPRQSGIGFNPETQEVLPTGPRSRSGRLQSTIPLACIAGCYNIAASYMYVSSLPFSLADLAEIAISSPIS